MKTVMQSLKEMETTLLADQPELAALEKIGLLRVKLPDRPGVTELLSKLQNECAPNAERIQSELAVIREAISILEEAPLATDSESTTDIIEATFPSHSTDPFAKESPPFQSASDSDWNLKKFVESQEMDWADADPLPNHETDPLAAEPVV